MALCLLVTTAFLQPISADVPSTPIEAALDALRSRFSNQIVIGFEETFDVRPDRTPDVDLGPPNSTLQQVIDRIRHANPNYKIDLLRDGLLHVYPANETADPAGCLICDYRILFSRQTIAWLNRC